MKQHGTILMISPDTHNRDTQEMRSMSSFKTSFKLCMLSVCLFLSACGFHLRGRYQLPSNFKTVYLQSAQPYTPFMSQLRQSLKSSGVSVVNNPFASPYTLNIQGENFNTAKTSVGSSQMMRQYTATYSVSYALQSAKGKTLYGPRTVSTTSTINTVENEELTSSRKLTETKNNMIQTLVSQLLFQLSSKNAAQIFQ